jgi:hypothetical protein
MPKTDVITIKRLRLLIVSALAEQHSMTPAQFANSDLPAMWGIDYKQATIQTYLSTDAVVSFPFLSVMCDRLGLGTLDRKIEIIRVHKYHLRNEQ